jgi:ABC-type protease/lipase transport system fused ATPase/permease subunit
VALNARLRQEQDATVRPTMIAAAIVRALRPAVQSATLGLGVYLAMAGACTSASILAAAIVLPRVLGPLEMAITHWRSFKAAHASADRLHGLLAQPPPSHPPQHSSAPGGVQIILRMRSDQARSASGAGARSMSSGLRPTAE